MGNLDKLLQLCKEQELIITINFCTNWIVVTGVFTEYRGDNPKKLIEEVKKGYEFLKTEDKK